MGCNMRKALLILLLIQCTLTFAGEDGSPTGKNCALSTPPDSAGEENIHGITLRIYPRARDIDSKYTGCQITWMPDGNKWMPLVVVAIVRGDAVRLWSPDKSDPKRFGCIYKKGKVIKGDAQNCASPESLIAKSVAPGCINKIQKAVAKFGLGASTPQGCEYQ